MLKAYSPIFYCLALLLTVIAAMPAGAQPNPFGGGGFDDPVTISGQVSQPRVAPGGELLIAVILDHQPGWHVWPAAGQAENDPSADVVIIPTEIRFLSEPPTGVTLGEIRWPKAYDALAAGGIVIKAYKGTAIAHIPVTIAEDAALGDVEIEIEVYYQACDDQVCIIPTAEPANVSFSIVAPDALGDLSEPDPSIFSEAARVGEPGDHEEIETPSPAEVPAAAGHGGENQSGFAFKAGLWGVFALVIVSMLWMVFRTFAISKKPLWRGLTSIIALVVIGGMVWYAAYLNQGGGDEDMLARFHEVWTPYSPEAFEAAQAEGKIPVLDFTADWCINCKVLEQTVLATDKALKAVSDPKFAPMQADITTNDAPGHDKLEELGPGGIPRLAVYHPHLDEPIQYKSFYTWESFDAALRGEEPSDLDASGDVMDIFGYRFNVKSAALIVVIALIAGLLLNFTPCVLPVIPIKVLSLHQQAGDPRRCLALGISFGLGIIAFFIAVGIPIAVLKVFDWGRMFSLWYVNLGLGLLIFIMGLGMVGLFTFRLPQKTYMFNPSHDTHFGSFLTGALTGVLSTPCTGPLLGATIAWVVTRPSWLALTVFAAMGVGMAFPYVLLAAKPQWVDRLPRTGPGSELVKQVMAILLIAVSVYFFGLAGSSVGL